MCCANIYIYIYIYVFSGGPPHPAIVTTMDNKDYFRVLLNLISMIQRLHGGGSSKNMYIYIYIDIIHIYICIL